MACHVNEMYPCILGESLGAGLPALLIRLAGCNLRCRYCDTTYSLSEAGTPRSVQELVAFWREGGLSHVLVTGGEPLLQADSVLLMQSLLDAGATVHLETNGSLTAREVPAAVRKVLDVKVPSSAPGLPPSFLLENYRYLQPWDQLKFVVSSREDYLWGLAFLLAHPAPLDPAHILFSPAGGQLEPVVLAEWMVQDRLAYRFSLQIHKVLWGNERGR